MEIGKPCLKYIVSFKTSGQKQPFADVFTNYIFKTFAKLTGKLLC